MNDKQKLAAERAMARQQPAEGRAAAIAREKQAAPMKKETK